LNPPGSALQEISNRLLGSYQPGKSQWKSESLRFTSAENISSP